MAVADSSALLQPGSNHSSFRAILAVGSAAAVLVGLFVFWSSTSVMRTDLCGQFVTDTPGQSQELRAEVPRGANLDNPLMRVGFVDRDAVGGPVLHTLSGAELRLRDARTC